MAQFWKTMVGKGKGVVLFTKSSCGMCTKAKSLLSEYSVPFKNYDVDQWNHTQVTDLASGSGHPTLPNIWLETTKIGGVEQLEQAVANKRLFFMLKEANISFNKEKAGYPPATDAKKH